MTQSPADSTPPAALPRLRRGLSAGLPRPGLLALTLFCVVASAIFLVAPFLKRTYAMAGTIKVTLQAFDPLPELARVPEATARELQPFAQQKQVTLDPEPVDGDTHTLRFATSDSSHDAGFVAIQSVANSYSEMVRHRADEMLSTYATSLAKRGIALDGREATVNRELDTFRQAHRGALPDDPDSILKQYEKMSTQVDDKQSHLRLVTEQIARLEEYRQGKRPLAPVPLPPAVNTPVPAPAPAPVAADPEVASLTAQLQLINDQIDEQLNKMNRTEQHPYVVDLKKKQADLQKKLDAAKARAAAGQPAPPQPRALAAPAGTPLNDPSLLAAQALDVQLQQLHAEKDLTDSEARALQSQKDSMQKAVDSLAGVRRDYAALNDQLGEIKKSRQALAEEKGGYDRRFGHGELAATGVVDVSTLKLDPQATEPSWPRQWAVYSAGIVAGLLAALAAALLAGLADRSLHTVREAADLLATPILGTVSEIRSPAGQRLRQLWMTFLRPGLMVALVLITAGSAILCHRALSNSHFDPNAGRNPRALLALNTGSVP